MSYRADSQLRAAVSVLFKHHWWERFFTSRIIATEIFDEETGRKIVLTIHDVELKGNFRNNVAR